MHGDVFRIPPAASVFCAYIGTGVQLFSLVIFLLLLAIMNMVSTPTLALTPNPSPNLNPNPNPTPTPNQFYPGNRGAMYTAAIVLYAVTP